MNIPELLAADHAVDLVAVDAGRVRTLANTIVAFLEHNAGACSVGRLHQRMLLDTNPAGAALGLLVIEGRVRVADGVIALVREPARMRNDAPIVWQFEAVAHTGGDLGLPVVGQVKLPSAAIKDAQANGAHLEVNIEAAEIAAWPSDEDVRLLVVITWGMP